MRNAAITMLLCAGLIGCSSGPSRDRACEVFSPAEIDLPTTQNDQRIDDQSTGDPTASGREQDC
ncbi:MAG: hypothetical protein ACN6O6_07645 [Pseudomonas sp.]|uniref:hypothetical protein n=1 Tax=Pseudomonas sp. TaxID=306 RepID=UPI003D0F0600